MSKVEQLKYKLIHNSNDFSDLSVSKREYVIEELIQAVRDEELDKLEESCDICTIFNDCTICPLRKTRHCP